MPTQPVTTLLIPNHILSVIFVAHQSGSYHTLSTTLTGLSLYNSCIHLYIGKLSLYPSNPQTLHAMINAMQHLFHTDSIIHSPPFLIIFIISSIPAPFWFFSIFTAFSTYIIIHYIPIHIPHCTSKTNYVHQPIKLWLLYNSSKYSTCFLPLIIIYYYSPICTCILLFSSFSYILSKQFFIFIWIIYFSSPLLLFYSF